MKYQNTALAVFFYLYLLNAIKVKKDFNISMEKKC